MRPYFVGVAGGSGSGKTTFARLTAEALGENVQIISHDFYYLPLSHLSFEERTRQNFDHPSTFDTELLIAHLKALAAGSAVDMPVYSYTEFTRLEETRNIKPTKVVIVEGFLVLENPELRSLFDMRLYIDTDADVRFMRRLKRDMNKRGRSMESVFEQYLATVKPMHEQFVEPSKKYADVIVPQGGHNTVALEMVLERIKSELAKQK